MFTSELMISAVSRLGKWKTWLRLRLALTSVKLFSKGCSQIVDRSLHNYGESNEGNLMLTFGLNSISSQTVPPLMVRWLARNNRSHSYVL